MRIAENAPMGEKFKYAPNMLSERDVQDALIELEAWQEMGEDFNGIADTPEDCKIYVEELEAVEEKPSDYDELKSFFEDCVDSLNKHWPCAEPYDQNLRQVIMEAISRGDVEETEES